MYIPLFFIMALITVESGGDRKAIGDNGLAVGCLQIHAGVVEDCNRLQDEFVFTLDDRKSFEMSVLMLQIYLEHYASEKRLGREATLEDMARIWNGGPNGYKKKSTEAYWQKVKIEIEKLQINGKVTIK